LFGSLLEANKAVPSNGTYEILGYRLSQFSPSISAFNDGVIIEADASPGLWNPQLLMIGSGVLE